MSVVEDIQKLKAVARKAGGNPNTVRMGLKTYQDLAKEFEANERVKDKDQWNKVYGGKPEYRVFGLLVKPSPDFPDKSYLQVCFEESEEI